MKNSCDSCKKVIKQLVDDNLKMREALEDIIELNSMSMEETKEFAKETLESLSKLTATQLGFEIGKVYRSKNDERCAYHIICETHYTAVWNDGSEIPVVHTIDCLGTLKDYEEIK